MRYLIQERDKLVLTRVVVFEFIQALKFKMNLPDGNLILLLQVCILILKNYFLNISLFSCSKKLYRLINFHYLDILILFLNKIIILNSEYIFYYIFNIDIKFETL